MSDEFAALVQKRAGRVRRNGTLEDAIRSGPQPRRIVTSTPVEPSGDWIQTFTGKRFYPADPRPDQIDIEDIARALSRICRFAGHCERFYSVAQHSVYVSGLVPPEHQLCALLHDATEAYLVDIPRPVKNLLTEYRVLEHRAWLAIAKRFDLPPIMPECVKDADNRMLLAEKDQLLKHSAAWNIPGKAAPVEIAVMDDTWAHRFFMQRFDTLMGCRNA